MPETSSPRRERRRSVPTIDPRTRKRELIDLLATDLARIAAGPSSPNMPPEEARGDGLELPPHAALGVVALVPTGGYPEANAGKFGERHDRWREATD